MRPRRAAPLLALLAALAGCGGDGSEPAVLGETPVDSALLGSAETVERWAYRREASADLDGDGQAERVVIAADVPVDAGGAPLWEDGHRWAVFAESAAGRRTMLYAAFVPRGYAEAAVLAGRPGERRSVLVRERTPERDRAYEIEYAGPGDAGTAATSAWEVEQWLPGAGALP